MFRPVSSVASQEFLVRLFGLQAAESLVDRTPIGTYTGHEPIWDEEVFLHSIPSFRKSSITIVLSSGHCFICLFEDMMRLMLTVGNKIPEPSFPMNMVKHGKAFPRLFRISITA